MLAKIKMALRISHNLLDEELEDLIQAACMDLELAGVRNINTQDALVIRAIVLYVKANFGMSDTFNTQEKFQKSYDLLKMHLSLSEEYTHV